MPPASFIFAAVATLLLMPAACRAIMPHMFQARAPLLTVLRDGEIRQDGYNIGLHEALERMP